MSPQPLALLPAVDVLGRKAVHLVRGRADSANVVGEPVDPDRLADDTVALADVTSG